MSFLDVLPRYIKPDFNRDNAEGDYYGSPLTMIGVNKSSAFQVARELMHSKTGAVTLKELALKSQFHAPVCQAFDKKLSHIVLAETFLRVFPDTASTLNPDFFDGVNDYFKRSEDTHEAKDAIYSHLVFSCLACVWQAFIFEKRSLAEESFFDMQHISISNQDKQFLTQDAVDIYKSLYRNACPNNLTIYLNQNLYNFLDKKDKLKPASCLGLKGLPKNSPERRKQRLFHGGGNAPYTPYKLSFNREPWSLFLHNYKKGNTINYQTPSDHFPFYGRHPRPTLLWTTLLLIDLYEQLSATVAKRIVFQESSEMNILDVMNMQQNDLTVDANSETPKPCKEVYRRLRQGNTHRFVSGSLNEATLKTATTDNPWIIDQYNGDLMIDQVSEDKAYTITLRIPEVVFDNLAEPTVLINIHVFYYHDEQRTTIPCTLLAEYLETCNGLENACFQVELDWRCMDNMSFDPRKTPCLAGLSCDSGKADIVVVFGK